MEEIARMQKNLLLIRRAVGWSASEFGEKIGVTRQTINNIENGRNKLNKTQYIAMRSVLDAEMNNSPEDTEMLKILLEVLVDNPENYSEDTRRELEEKANLMTPGILVGAVSRRTVSKEWIKVTALVGGIALVASPVLAIGVTAVSAWLQKLLGMKAENVSDGQQSEKSETDSQNDINESDTEETCSDSFDEL